MANPFLLLSGFALILVYFFPILSEINSVYLGTYPDAEMFIWNFWWADRSLSTGSDLFHADSIFLPFGADLYLHTFVPGLTVPLAFLSSVFTPTALYNISIVISFSLNFAVAYLLFLRVAGSSLVGFCIALALTFHPFSLGHMNGGHLNLVAWFPMAISMLGFFQLNVRAKFALVAVGILFVAFIDFYYLYFLLLACLAIVPFKLREGWKAGLFTCCAALLVFVVVFTRVMPVADTMRTGDYTDNHRAYQHGADISSFFVPSEYQVAGSNAFTEKIRAKVSLNSAESGVYLTWSLIAMIAIGVLYKRQLPGLFFWCGILFILLSLGPRISLLGGVIAPNPVYTLFKNLFPFFPTVPVRFAFVGILMLFIYAAETLKDSRNARWLCVLLLVEIIPLTLPRTEVKESRTLVELSERNDLSAIYDTSESHRVMLNQTVHEKKVIGGHLARIPKKSIKLARRNQFIRYVKGNPHKSEELRTDFDQLNVGGVLVPRIDSSLLNTLGALPWLKLEANDSEYSLFVPITESYVPKNP